MENVLGNKGKVRRLLPKTVLRWTHGIELNSLEPITFGDEDESLMSGNMTPFMNNVKLLLLIILCYSSILLSKLQTLQI